MKVPNWPLNGSYLSVFQSQGDAAMVGRRCQWIGFQRQERVPYSVLRFSGIRVGNGVANADRRASVSALDGVWKGTLLDRLGSGVEFPSKALRNLPLECFTEQPLAPEVQLHVLNGVTGHLPFGLFGRAEAGGISHWAGARTRETALDQGRAVAFAGVGDGFRGNP